MSDGRFGIHGGQYIPETLMNEIINLEKQYNYSSATGCWEIVWILFRSRISRIM